MICDETEIGQVLLNIIKNAAQAMDQNPSETDRPRLVVRTRQMPDQVVIEIEDNGPGLDEKQRKSIFEPFFTTKPAGEGIGLELSVSYFIIVTRHNGKLSVDSQKGSDSRFTIELPLLSGT